MSADDMRRRANTWRGTVSITLRALGIPNAEARPASRRLADDMFQVQPDVTGLPGLHVLAAPISPVRLSTYLNRAALAADERGNGDIPVLVFPRQEHEPAESYVVMRLCDLARLVQQGLQARDDDLTRSEV